MEKHLEQKLEVLIHQLKNQKSDGKLLNQQNKTPISIDKLIKYAEELKTAEKGAYRQNEELLFAYQTLEVGYQRYWEFFNFAPDGYLVTDTDGIIREANQTALSMLSISRPELLGKPITNFIPDIKHPDFGMQLNWFIGSQILEVNLRPPNCIPFFASLSVSPQCNIQNKTVGLLWLIRDITERKKMEEALQKSKTELSLILEQTPYILWTTDTGLKLTSITGAGLSSLNKSPTENNGISVAEYFGIQSGTALLKAHENALIGPSQTLELEWGGRTFQCTVEALKNTHQQISGVIGAAFDITERKKAEKILEKSEKFNSSLLQNSPNPISVINADTSIAYVNPAFEKLTGFPSQMVIGRKAPYPWWAEENSTKAVESFRKFLSKKKGKQEKLFRKKNGDQFWVEITTILVEDKDESNYHLQTWIDITEAKHLRENLEFYVMQITKVQEEERKRIAQELHEETLQSLAAICLATESIIKSREQDPKRSLADLAELREKISGVIEEVRRFSYGLRPGVLDYLGLLAAFETLTDELNEKGIKAHVEVSGKEKSLPPDMEITLFRIAQEALSNVKKYSLANRVDINMCYFEDKVRLMINDNGQGFSPPARLSELANQGKLGIIGMEERARLFGGNFYIQSHPKNGTKIIVTLPVSG